MTPSLPPLFGVVGVVGVFGASALVSAVAPAVAELALLGAGVVVYRDFGGPLPIVLAALAGVLVGDASLHRAGFRGRRPLDEARTTRADALFARYGDGAIVVARIAPGARGDLFSRAGATGRPLRRVLLLDALAAALHVPLFVTAGAWLGAELERAHLVVDRTRLLAVLALLALLGVGALVRRRRPR